MYQLHIEEYVHLFYVFRYAFNILILKFIYMYVYTGV